MKIAVILSGMDIEYVRETLKGIMEQAKADRNELYIFNSYSGADEKIKYYIGDNNIYSLFKPELFDGVILFANLIQGYQMLSDIIRRIKEAKVPTVCISSNIEGLCNVGTDSYVGMRQVVEHLVVHHGMSRFAYISGQDFNTDSKERYKAFCDVLTENHIPLDSAKVYKGTFTFDTGYDAGLQIAKQDEFPQAVICAMDGMAMGVRRAFLELGISIPKQIALTGFDNVFEARFSVPVLATASNGQRRIGKAAAEKLNAYDKRREELTSEKFPATLIIGESCGCESHEKIEEFAIREQYIAMKENFDKQLLANNQMTDDLHDSKDYHDLICQIKEYVKKLECNRFYLCLCPEVVQQMKGYVEKNENGDGENTYRVYGYPERMSVELAYENGEFVTVDHIETVQIVPQVKCKDSQCSVYCLSPIHYQDRCLGYLVVEGSRFVMESPMYRTWLVNLSSCLENIRKQAVMQMLFKRVDNMYVRDALTGLYNRFGFDRYTEEKFEQCIKKEKSFMIFFADVDGLKKINDQNGHEMGDRAICAVADALRQICRQQDICARFGGDEYVVYAQDYTERDADLFGKKLDNALQEYNDKMKQDFIIHASYGYQIVYPKQGDTLEECIKKADAQMYIRKKERKNKMVST